MCFSAPSSFTAAFLLSAIGFATLRNNYDKKLIMFALIPLMFAAQQLMEGIIWLTIEEPNLALHKVCVYAYLTFAMIIWPTWIPLALTIYENGIRKKLLKFITLIGSGIAGYVIFKFLTSTITAIPTTNSICYKVASTDPFIIEYGLILYVIPVILPFFITRLPLAKLSGIFVTISLFIAYCFKYENYGSVWCFFAALLSVIVFFSLNEVYNENRTNLFK